MNLNTESANNNSNDVTDKFEGPSGETSKPSTLSRPAFNKDRIFQSKWLTFWLSFWLVFERDAMFCKTCLAHGKLTHVKHIKNTSKPSTLSRPAFNKDRIFQSKWLTFWLSFWLVFERDAMFCKTCLAHGKLTHVKHIKNTQSIVHTSLNCTYHFRLPFYLAYPMTLMAHTFTKWPHNFSKSGAFGPFVYFAFPIPAILLKVYL